MSLTSRRVTLREWNEEVMPIKDWEHTGKGRLKSSGEKRTKRSLSETEAPLRGKLKNETKGNARKER